MGTLGGYIKIHRQLLGWEWFDHPEMVQLWIYLLLKANYQPSDWHGIIIPRGSLITTLATISNDTGISIQTLRTCMTRLKSTNEITSKSTNKYTIITICKYEDYNLAEITINKQNNKQLNNQSTNKKERSKEYIKERKEEEKETPLRGSKEKEGQTSFSPTPDLNSFALRKQKFYDSLTPYIGQYPEEMIDEFFKYWSEANRSRTKMKYENESTWELSLRLARWAKNDGKYTVKFRPSQSSPPDPLRKQRMEEARQIEQKEREHREAQRKKAAEEKVDYDTYLALKRAGKITKPSTPQYP